MLFFELSNSIPALLRLWKIRSYHQSNPMGEKKGGDKENKNYIRVIYKDELLLRCAWV